MVFSSSYPILALFIVTFKCSMMIYVHYCSLFIITMKKLFPLPLMTYDRVFHVIIWIFICKGFFKLNCPLVDLVVFIFLIAIKRHTSLASSLLLFLRTFCKFSHEKFCYKIYFFKQSSFYVSRPSHIF